MAKSINRRLAESLTGGAGLDSADVLALTGGGTTYYDTLDSLPVTELTAGNTAFVEENRRLYVSDGNGWYNASFVNRGPRWDSGGEPDASYTIVDSATPLIITARAIDSDNVNFINQAAASDSAQYLVDISNDSSVFTFNPRSADSIGLEVAAGNLVDSGGDFVYTFKWSDGINFVSKAVTISYNAAGGSSSLLSNGDRGFVVGEDNYLNTIQYWDIVNDGNAADFGDLTSGSEDTGSTCNGTRAIAFFGSTGGLGFPDSYSSNIDYFATTTTGNATSFGNTTTQGVRKTGLSDGTYGLCAGTYGGITGSGVLTGVMNVIDYITINTTGNAVDFGDMSEAKSGVATTNDNTRGVFVGGFTGNPDYVNTMEYVTIATPGNAVDFGDDLTINYMSSRGVMGDGTYGVWQNGYTGSALYSTVIAYITIQTTGNATDFGDIATATRQAQSTSNATHGNIVGGRTAALAGTSTIEKITIATPGNATLGTNTLDRGVYQSAGLSGAAA